MLIDPIIYKGRHNHLNDYDEVLRVSKGVYIVEHFNFDFLISQNGGNLFSDTVWTDTSIAFTDDGKMYTRDNVFHTGVNDIFWYGVCDSIEQFFEDGGKKLIDSKRNYCISFTRIIKKEQSPSGGWRWHKWGPYMGRHKPKHEYLYDEPDIDEVLVYNVYEKIGEYPDGS